MMTEYETQALEKLTALLVLGDKLLLAVNWLFLAVCAVVFFSAIGALRRS